MLAVLFVVSRLRLTVWKYFALIVPNNRMLTAVIRLVIEVSEVTILVLEYLLMFFRFRVSKPNKWLIFGFKL